MEILFSKHHLGENIVKAFSFIPEYTAKIITKTEGFEEDFGILPKEVKIELTSLAKIQGKNKEYKLFITIDNITLLGEYIKIDMEIKYLYNNGYISYIPILVHGEGADLKERIETLIYQVVGVLNNGLEHNGIKP